MQLPGMNFDPVRLSLDVTWWPDEDGFGLSRRLWTRPHRGDTWQLEDMATTGTLVRLDELQPRYTAAARDAYTWFSQLVHTQGEPF